ncbi:uncharacterized protein LOC131947298 [Physella acuta]|uniref:uncharacterized protein LOC131947298 n=1 Tax=Physella acuta TaxID=109671 RepID=UPI0027DCE145|nr:uncharacterized protein LOC131947298 [Physella acuta]
MEKMMTSHPAGDNDTCGSSWLVDPKSMFSELHQRAVAMGMTADDLTRLEFVKQTRRNQPSAVRKLCQKVLTSCMYVLIVLTLSWLADFPLSRDRLARLVLQFRGVSGRAATQEKCLLEKFKVMEAPRTCRFCQDVDDVMRVANVSASQFEAVYSGRPLVVTDAMNNWSAIHVFSFHFFKEIYNKSYDTHKGKDACQFFGYDTEFRRLSQVFEMDDDRIYQKDGSLPWYVGWSNCDPAVTEILRHHYHKPYFLPEDSESEVTDWIFMGSPGYGAKMHVDKVNLPSWQAQIAGHKLWVLEPPVECYFTCTRQMSVTVHPGEIIVLDTNKWFHSTKVVGDDVSITIGAEFD